MNELGVIPQSPEAEVNVLCSLLIDQYGTAAEFASSLTPSYFFNRNHRLVFEAMLGLFNQGKTIDTITVTDALRTNGKLEEIGGEYFVHSLIRATPTSAHIQGWIEILKLKFILRSMAEMGARMQKECMNGADLTTLSKYESEIFNLSSSSLKSDNRLQEAAAELDRQIELRRSGQKIFGLTSGIASFDKYFGGFQKGQYYVVAGRPSAGKTAMADQIVTHFLLQKRSVLYVALESSEDRVLGKLACKLEDLCYSRFPRGFFNAQELAQFERANSFLKSSSLVLVRPNDITGLEIRSLIRKEKRNNNIDLVVVDYLQKITVGAHQNERQAIGDASQQIQRACVETGVPALILVQLNREADKERPRMSHLKESGQIEQDADNIVLLWHEKDPSEVPQGELIPMVMTIEKNKDGIRGWDQNIFFDGQLMKFKEQAI